HRAGLDLAEHLLPGVGAVAHVLDVDRVEHQTGRLSLFVVTANTVLVEDHPRLEGERRNRARALRLSTDDLTGREGARGLQARRSKIAATHQRPADETDNRGSRHCGVQHRVLNYVLRDASIAA